MRKKFFPTATAGLLLLSSWPRGSLTLQRAPVPQGPSTPQGPDQQPEQGERLFGTVATVGVDRFEIKKQDGSGQTVMVTDKTQYREGQQEIQLEDIKSGNRVLVVGRTNDRKEFVAATVRRVTGENMFSVAGEGDTAFGEITSIEAGQFKVRSPRAGERIVVVNDQTAFMKEGKAIALKDLKVGDTVFATGKEDQGHFVATRVVSGRMQFQRGGRPENAGRDRPPRHP